jgi:hypothetical protein
MMILLMVPEKKLVAFPSSIGGWLVGRFFKPAGARSSNPGRFEKPAYKIPCV